MKLCTQHTAFLLVLGTLPSTAAAQLPTIEVKRFKEVQNVTTVFNQSTSAAPAQGAPFLKLPMHPSVMLTSVYLKAQHKAVYTVSASASSAQPGSGTFGWTTFEACSSLPMGSANAWGISDGNGSNASTNFNVAAGETTTKRAAWDQGYELTLNGNSSKWATVVNDCTGANVPIPFTSFAIASINHMSTSPGVTVNGLQVEVKSSLQFDIQATLQPSIDATSYCTALAGSSGVPSTIEAYGAPVSGQPDFVVRLKDAQPASTAMLVIATGQANTPFGSFFACLSGTRLSSSPVVSPDPSGTYDFSETLTAAMPGTTVYGQVFLREGGTGTTLSTQGLAISVLP